jgi:hypothetical protein
VIPIDGLLFENRSSTAVVNIRLFVPSSGNFVSCGHISPGATCASSFPNVDYAGEAVEVSWFQGGQEWSTGQLTLTVDEVIQSAGAGRVRVVVLAPGSAGALLVSSGN